jgi:hypothetical protein
MPIDRTSLRLILALAVAVSVALAAATAIACPVGRDGACLKENQPCGPSREHGRCETTKHPVWRGVKLICACHIPTPHGSIVVP